MKKDTVWKSYLADSSRFADLVNGILFHGIRTVTAEDITEADTQTGYSGQPRDRRKRGTKLRDTVRRVRFRDNYVRIGMECEEYPDYSMPLRDLGYTVGEYEKQAADIRREVKKELPGLHGGERMYRFKKDSRIRPSVSVVLYFGREEWDGPHTLYDMTDFTDLPQEIRHAMQDYRMQLVNVRRLEDTGMFQTDVRQVFDFIRYSENKTALKKLVMEDPYYQAVEADAWEVIVQYAKVGNLVKAEEYYREDGKIDMCTAIRELMEDERREGFAEGEKSGEERGRKIGEERGRKIGEKQGRKIGKERTEQRLIRNLARNMHLTEEEAAAVLGVRTEHPSDPAKK